MATTKVKVRFHGVREHRTYEVGETYEGTELRIRQLAERGYVEAGQKKKPAPKRAAKPKEQ